MEPMVALFIFCGLLFIFGLASLGVWAVLLLAVVVLVGLTSWLVGGTVKT